MSPRTRYAKKHAKARQRRYLKAQERVERDRRQAQHAAEALQQTLDDLGLPEALVPEIEGRLRSQHKLLGKIVGVMCPPLFGCRTSSELCRVRGWDKNLPSRLLGALPKRSWLKRLRRLGLEVLEPLWRHAASTSAATRSLPALLVTSLVSVSFRVNSSFWCGSELSTRLRRVRRSLVLA